MRRVLLTGATGFVGRQILARMSDWDVRVAGRTRPDGIDAERFFSVTIDGRADFTGALDAVDVVIHCAGLSSASGSDALETCREVNTRGTANLARQAAEAGVRRFVFLSSAKVHGEESPPGRPFQASDPVAPEGPYATSKAEAEQALAGIAASTGMEVVVVRPPLVYGREAKANFRALVGLVRRGVHSLLGDFDENLRSLIAVENLVDVVLVCAEHPGATNRTFLVSDGADLSTTGLLRGLDRALGRRRPMIRVPRRLVGAVATAAGKRALYRRLAGSMQVDIASTREVLGWSPPLTVEEALRRSVGNGGSSSWRVPRRLRAVDIALAGTGLAISWPVLVGLTAAGKLDTGSPLFFQERVGKDQKPFTLVKFRTMTVSTASVASHLASASSITPYGRFLRRTKLDELPQLWNVLKGDMSLVGPRPCLYTQDELVAQRAAHRIFDVRPGITGLAQVMSVDMSTPARLVALEREMLSTLSLASYLAYVRMTLLGAGAGDAVVGAAAPMDTPDRVASDVGGT